MKNLVFESIMLSTLINNLWKIIISFKVKKSSNKLKLKDINNIDFFVWFIFVFITISLKWSVMSVHVIIFVHCIAIVSNYSESERNIPFFRFCNVQIHLCVWTYIRRYPRQQSYNWCVFYVVCIAIYSFYLNSLLQLLLFHSVHIVFTFEYNKSH